MRQFKEVKKEILDFIDSYREENKIDIHSEITQINDKIQIAIYDEVSTGHFFLSYPQPRIKLISQDEFLHLSNEELHKILKDTIEKDDEYPEEKSTPPL